MDVFDNFSVRHYDLAEHFDAIYSSSKHGKLKTEDDSLFAIACKETSAEPNEVALVDDSTGPIEAIKGFGGHAFVYENYTESHVAFEAWLGELAGLNFTTDTSQACTPASQRESSIQIY